MIFLSHSHRDQEVSYGLSEWIHGIWPDLFVYQTHGHFPELVAIEEQHYLRAVAQSRVLICLVSKSSFGSTPTAVELRIARKCGRPTILVLHPNMTTDEASELNSVIEFWKDLYGDTIDLSDPTSDARLLRRLRTALGRATDAAPKRSLASLLKTPRCMPESRVLPVPNHDEIFAGRATRKQAEQWLGLLLKGWDHRMRSRGLVSGVEAMQQTCSPEHCAAALMTSYPSAVWGALMVQLRPLINDSFRSELKVLIKAHGDGHPEIRRALEALRLLSSEV